MPSDTNDKRRFAVIGKGIELPLSKGLFVVVDEASIPLVKRFSWHAHRIKKRDHDIFYARSIVNGHSLYMHRVVMGCERGDGKIVDHINGDTLDNRTANLRLASPRLNALNRADNRAHLAAMSDRQKLQFIYKYARQFAQWIVDGHDPEDFFGGG